MGFGKCNLDECFYGSVTVGERGQVVIPSQARQEMGIKPGNKLLIMKHPVLDGLMMARFESVKEFIDDMSQSLENVNQEEEAE